MKATGFRHTRWPSAIRWKVPGQYTRRLLVGLAPLVPLAGSAAYVAHDMTWPIDPTPLLFSVGLLALGNAIFTGGLLQALPISQHDLIEQLPIGVVLTDRAGTVIDVNPAAERLLGVSEASVSRLTRGRTIDPESKEGELAILFVRLYRSLDSLLGGDEAASRSWIHAPNHHLGAIPADMVRTVTGLTHALEYLDAMRGKS